MPLQLHISHLLAADLTGWIELRQRLWPDEPEVATEIEGFLESGLIAGIPHAVLVARAPGHTHLLGFAECSLPSVGPVHLEGWFVRPEWRRQGIGRRLIEAATSWTREQGRSELTSDTTTPYAPLSVPAHLRCGFHLAHSPSAAPDHAAAGAPLIRFSLPLLEQQPPHTPRPHPGHGPSMT